MSEKFQNLLQQPLSKIEFQTLQSENGIAKVHVMVSQLEMSGYGGDEYFDLLASKISTEAVFAIVESEIVAISEDTKDLIIQVSLEVSGKILPATYVSSWDGGILMESKCLFDTEKHTVFNVSTAPGDHENLEFLDEEYILLSDGSKIPVVNEEDFEGSEEEFLKALSDSRIVIVED